MNMTNETANSPPLEKNEYVQELFPILQENGKDTNGLAALTRKMSRDGLVERNAVTGEDVRVGKREADVDLKSGKRSTDPFLQLDKRSDGDTAKKKKQKQRRIAEQSARAENTADVGVQPQATILITDTPKQADIPIVTQSETSEGEELRHEQWAKP